MKLVSLVAAGAVSSRSNGGAGPAEFTRMCGEISYTKNYSSELYMNHVLLGDTSH